MKETLFATIAVILILLLLTAVNLAALIQPVKAQQATASFSDDFSTESGTWQYAGSAYRDKGNQCLVLTTSDSEHTGIAFFKAPIQGSFTANFRYKAGGGFCSADGFTMFFYKQKYPSTIDYTDDYGVNGVSGGRLGFNSLSVIPGYGIEFDGWQNVRYEFAMINGGQPNPSADPSDNHIALIKDFVGDHLAYVDDSRVADNNWHKVSVQVQGSSVSVSIDNGVVLKWTGDLNRTYDGFGFSGANGGCGNNWHVIDDFSITAHDIHTPTITTSCVSSTTQQTFNVYKINGALTYNGVGISGAPIFVSYSISAGETWQDLTLVYTDSDGSYSAIWLPTVTGNYLLKAVYKGDENYLGTTNVISFAIEPSIDQNVFSITSNSTITALSFDTATKQLSFNVTGDSGTKGYVYIYIPKSLAIDAADLTVTLDGNQTSYTAQSQNDGWLLYITYHHSSHTIMIGLNTSTRTGENSGVELIGNYIIYIISVALAVIVLVLAVALKAWKRSVETAKT
jgi:hypothetical protein